MKKLCLALTGILFVLCSPTISLTTPTHMKNFATELNEVLTSAVAAYKIADYLNNTGFKPNSQYCWVCTLVMSTMEKYTLLKNVTIDEFIMKDICPRFPLTYRSICQQVVDLYGPTVIKTLIETESPDAACAAVGYCEYKECKLFPKGEEPKVSFSSDWAQYFQIQPNKKLEAPSAKWLDELYTKILLETVSSHEDSALGKWIETLETAGEDPLDWLKELLHKLFTNHTAIVDLDNDYFSETSGELRGYNWRGRDCNDNDASIHPGRKTDPKPGVYDDYNCNGIAGVNTTTGQAYKDLFCSNSGQIGVVVMGDSAGAHCEVPVQWVNASMWDNYTWEDVIQSLADELDLPHMSAYTGYKDEGYHGPANSFYKYLYQRNKCNFRDYQNIAVNGGASSNVQNTLIRIARSQTDDYPVIVFLELIGNDVCDHHNSTDYFTTVEEFRTNLIGILDAIDPLVPPGSHLVALGLANGSIIFESVDGRTHPVGVTYNQFYDYLNCFNASLCWGWLNTNQTVRDATTQRAMELSAVYNEVFSNYTAKNFDTMYYDFPTNEIVNNWTQAGNDPYLLIEPVDGFRPSQIFNSMLGDYLWASLERDHPE